MDADIENINTLVQSGKLDLPFDDLEAMPRQGNNSITFRARCKKTHLPVVLKFERHASDEYRRRAFTREGDVLRLLEGRPNVTALIRPLESVGCDYDAEGLPRPLRFTFRYLAIMHYPSTLLEYIKRGGDRFSDRLRLFRCVVKGLSQVHSARACHRDLKPENCFLTTDDKEAVVGDFGCSRREGPQDDIVGEYDLVGPGDHRYVPPELFITVDGFAAWRAADFYSLGCILYELATGKLLADQMASAMAKLTHARDVARSDGSAANRKKVAKILRNLQRNGHLPDIPMAAPVPGAGTRVKVERLYRQLCAFEPERRVDDFDAVFRQVDDAIAVAIAEETATPGVAQDVAE